MNKFDIYERCENFAVRVINLIESIPDRRSVGIIGNQLIRSSGSVGSNLCEADNARTRKEFLSCLSISLKEIKESKFWLRVLKKTNWNFEKQILIT